nr:hypothetical protein CFP56_71281 [Quercus suber]
MRFDRKQRWLLLQCCHVDGCHCLKIANMTTGAIQRSSSSDRTTTRARYVPWRESRESAAVMEDIICLAHVRRVLSWRIAA